MRPDDHVHDVDSVADVVEAEPEGRAEVVQLPEHCPPDDHDPVVQQRCRHHEQPLQEGREGASGASGARLLEVSGWEGGGLVYSGC